MERWRRPVSWASCSQCTVLPTPGVPVMITFGVVRMAFSLAVSFGWFEVEGVVWRGIFVISWFLDLGG